MTKYYSDTRRAAADLSLWVNNQERQDWSEFIRMMTLRYGFGEMKLKRMIKEGYPDFEIQDEKLIDRVR